ncbi:hypothetical protein DFJ73DRAFT_34452 [Zopfochytrium polystomum]|nr:hypothetical protein DFJ73DRAFT_34452 [Zopfochytrium polystomum]
MQLRSRKIHEATPRENRNAHTLIVNMARIDPPSEMTNTAVSVERQATPALTGTVEGLEVRTGRASVEPCSSLTLQEGEAAPAATSDGDAPCGEEAVLATTSDGAAPGGEVAAVHFADTSLVTTNAALNDQMSLSESSSDLTAGCVILARIIDRLLLHFFPAEIRLNICSFLIYHHSFRPFASELDQKTRCFIYRSVNYGFVVRGADSTMVTVGYKLSTFLNPLGVISQPLTMVGGLRDYHRLMATALYYEPVVGDCYTYLSKNPSVFYNLTNLPFHCSSSESYILRGICKLPLPSHYPSSASVVVDAKCVIHGKSRSIKKAAARVAVRSEPSTLDVRDDSFRIRTYSYRSVPVGEFLRTLLPGENEFCCYFSF